jgi:hypothetical protein
MDVEAELVPLIQSLTGYKTATREPDPKPQRFIQLRRQGGTAALSRASSDAIFRDRPLIDFFISAEDEELAMSIAQQVRSFMMSLPETQPLSVTCYDVGEVVFTWLDDVKDGVLITPRVWASYELNIRYNG